MTADSPVSPRVSVLMLTFNRPQFLDRAIRSVVNQTLTDWELLVVHDGSNEEIALIMEYWVRHEPRVRYLRRREIGNIAQANNHGLREARGQYIAVLDDDDYWLVSDKLEQQVNFLNDHPDHVACGGGAVVMDLDGQEVMRYQKPASDLSIKRGALVANPMVHSTTLYRKDQALAVGLYDESLSGYQDWDFFLKLGKFGKLHNFQVHFLAYQMWQGGGTFQAQRSNRHSALQIVRRHRGAYPRYLLAWTMAVLQYAYSYLPVVVRKLTFGMLNKIKKTVFSANP